MPEIGTASTQITTTLNSIQSRGNLNSNVNMNDIVSKSNSIFEMAIGDDELPDKFESNVDNKSVLSMEKSWCSGYCCPHYHNRSHAIQAKQENHDKKMEEKKMIEEYKLLESVAEMVQKYEQKSHLENN